jgi:hypothetical protein
MKMLTLLTICLTAQLGFAKVNCSAEGEKVSIDPQHKEVEILRDGQIRKVQILAQNHNAYKLFGESTYKLEGGYVLGLKASKTKSKKNLTVFLDGEPVASLNDCSVN